MITVIKHGNTTRTVNCPICDCVFICHKKDILTCCGVKEIKCPECDSYVIVEESVYGE